jgi:hypothetical protein
MPSLIGNNPNQVPSNGDLGTMAFREQEQFLALAGTQTVSGAKTFSEIITASKGVAFPATQVASADANTLDDYEEGTFTPAYQTSNNDITFSPQAAVNGKYTKIGNMVYFSLMIRGLISGGTGNLLVTGLPFTVSSVNGAGVPVSIGANYLWTSSPGSNPVAGGTTINLGTLGASNWTATSIAATQAGSFNYNEIILSGSYAIS